jgi:hypothetical protein
MTKKQHPMVIRNDFLSDWQRLTQIIRLFALRREQRYEVDPAKYHQMHESLLKTCRAAPEKEGPENWSFYSEVEDLLGPWVTLESLAQADDEIVWGLLCRCEQVERVLGARPARNVNWRRINLVWLGLAGVVVAVVVLLLTWGSDPASWPLVLTVKHSFRRATAAVGVDSTVQYLVLGGIIVSLAAAALVCRSARGQ